MKFMVKGKLIVINGEEDIFLSYLASYRYIEGGEESLEMSSQAIEVSVVTTHLVEKIKKLETSVTSWRDLHVVVGCRNPECWGKMLEISEKMDCLGLGYQISEAGKVVKYEKKIPHIL